MDPETYAEFQTESEGHFEGIGAELTMELNKETGEMEVVVANILPEGPASRTPLMADDVIVAVDGASVRGKTLNEVVKMIRGVGGTDVVLTVRHPNSTETTDITITRGRVEFPIVQWKMLDDGIGYLWLRSFNRVAATEVQNGLNALKQQGMKALLLDLSSNPGGMLDQAVAVADLFIDNAPVTYIRTVRASPVALRARRASCSKNVPMVALMDQVVPVLRDRGCRPAGPGRSTVVGRPATKSRCRP